MTVDTSITIQTDKSLITTALVEENLYLATTNINSILILTSVFQIIDDDGLPYYHNPEQLVKTIEKVCLCIETISHNKMDFYITKQLAYSLYILVERLESENILDSQENRHDIMYKLHDAVEKLIKANFYASDIPL
jgi:hypothetical protein